MNARIKIETSGCDIGARSPRTMYVSCMGFKDNPKVKVDENPGWCERFRDFDWEEAKRVRELILEQVRFVERITAEVIENHYGQDIVTETYVLYYQPPYEGGWDRKGKRKEELTPPYTPDLGSGFSFATGHETRIY